MSDDYRLLAAAINHPDGRNPYYGLFNHRSLRALDAAGVALDVVSPRPYAPPVGPYADYGDIPQRERWGPYVVHHPRFWYLLPKRLLYAVSGRSYANRVPEYAAETFDTPDVVHACHLYPDGYGMLPYVREHDLPLLVTAHGKLLNTFPDLPPGVASQVRETLAAADRVCCVSDALAATARELTDPATVETVPIGASPDRFPVDREAALRRELEIDPATPVVLFVGEFSERKGIEELLAVLPSFDPEAVTFVFVGHGGRFEERLRRELAEHGFSGRRVYTGVSSLAVRRWFAVADLLVLPSRAEGRPTVIYEAMASRTAVLATRVGGVPEQVVDGETGRLVSPRDPAALESVLASLVTDRDRLARMGRAGHRRLRERGWTWRAHAERLARLHRAAIDDHAARDRAPAESDR